VPPPQVIVRNLSGLPVEGVKVIVTGPATLHLVTDASGVAPLGQLPNGSYRLRFEHEDFITLEREVSIERGRAPEIYVALSMAPSLPQSPAPEPRPAPAPPPPAVEVPGPTAPPAFVSIPDYLDKNYIGREPVKESVLGCLAGSTTRLLQLRDSVPEHTHADTDEVLYVVAGEGTVRLRTDSFALAPGSLSIIPRGVPHAIDRRGRNPLIAISTQSGTPCRFGELAQAASGVKK
jgi:mannose-6-phosphate isomerase-like protein (cupin superfamily)